MNKYILTTLIAIIPFSAFKTIKAQVSNLPLVQIQDLIYQGGFRLPSTTYGASSTNYATGTIEYNNANHSLFVSGFDLDGAIAEFSIPNLVNSTNLSLLNTATNLQSFRKVLNLTPDNNPQAIDRITGMSLINNKLVVNALEYYDAPANNTHTTLILDSPNSIASSSVNGYYSLTGEAHAGGWISPIPAQLQTLLGGDYISGNSSRYPINGRSAIGISAFAFNASSLSNSTTNPIATTTLLDFDLTNPLYASYNTYNNANYNLVSVNGQTPPGHTFATAMATVGTNNLWTEVSQASYGIIIPGTRTYLTIGSSGGHNSGIGYKPTQNNGYQCPGPCSYDTSDNYNYFWLWDVNDLINAKNAIVNPYDIRPYASGVFNAPFQTDVYTNTPEFHPIVGGTYNVDSGLLYLSVYDGAPINNPYDKNPVIIAYKVIQNIPLPVQKIELQASYQTTHIALQWEIAEYNDGNSLTIERSEDGIHFYPIKKIIDNSIGTNQYNDYEYPLDLEKIFYRIALKNKKEETSYSLVQSIRIPSDQPQVRFYPNPTSSYFHISIGNNDLDRVIIYDQSGQLMKEADKNKINVSHLAPGIYLVKIILQDGNILFNKLSIQN